MPFDGTNFSPDPFQPPQPPRGKNGAAVLVIILSVLLLITPFSLAACTDMVRYAQRH